MTGRSKDGDGDGDDGVTGACYLVRAAGTDEQFGEMTKSRLRHIVCVWGGGV